MAAGRMPEMAEAGQRLVRVLRAPRGGTVPHRLRAHHGELGPDRVLIDDQGQPAVIDIEGAMYSLALQAAA